MIKNTNLNKQLILTDVWEFHIKYMFPLLVQKGCDCLEKNVLNSSLVLFNEKIIDRAI